MSISGPASQILTIELVLVSNFPYVMTHDNSQTFVHIYISWLAFDFVAYENTLPCTVQDNVGALTYKNPESVMSLS